MHSIRRLGLPVPHTPCALRASRGAENVVAHDHPVRICWHGRRVPSRMHVLDGRQAPSGGWHTGAFNLRGPTSRLMHETTYKPAADQGPPADPAGHCHCMFTMSPSIRGTATHKHPHAALTASSARDMAGHLLCGKHTRKWPRWPVWRSVHAAEPASIVADGVHGGAPPCCRHLDLIVWGRRRGASPSHTRCRQNAGPLCVASRQQPGRDGMRHAASPPKRVCGAHLQTGSSLGHRMVKTLNGGRDGRARVDMKAMYAGRPGHLGPGALASGARHCVTRDPEAGP